MSPLGRTALTEKELAGFREWAASLRLGPTFTVVHRLLDTVAVLLEDKAKLLTALRRDFHADSCPCDACAYRKFVLKDVKP